MVNGLRAAQLDDR